ncbi:2-hydroxyisoflavanone dehydratase-like [Ipomoea triloba]|uniref:2-hydroxyisoflavanone dehydratase-like n=1 Tax=Ipomoea triloba TaxID=35885 RepID=UPI00125D640F|nr:2-hydroxyisoflavanone dehydratase-like [Ipomoea triloba]
MASPPASTKVVHDFFPIFRVYDDGRVERFKNHVSVPPTDDPETGVQSKDVVIVPENNVWARLYLPKVTDGAEKFPVLFYIHGGAFSIESASSATYDKYLHAVTAKANVVTVSVEYRLAPEHKLPACYDDSWAVMQWVASHGKDGGQGSDPWLKTHADLSRVFLAGDSAGANIAHYMMVKASEEKSQDCLKPVGMILGHPYFGISGEPDKLWEIVYPDCPASGDPMGNPAAIPGLLSQLGCSKILVCIAEKDFIRDRGLKYYEALKNSGWGGHLELVDSDGEEHVFHLLNPTCEQADLMMNRVVAFLKST